MDSALPAHRDHRCTLLMLPAWVQSTAVESRAELSGESLETHANKITISQQERGAGQCQMDSIYLNKSTLNSRWHIMQ